jgi:enamine deaminase RidA (YjgF/YER057c/UK114 family)
MESDSDLKLDYLSLAELADRPAAWWQSVLGVAAFDAAAPRAASADVPMASIATPVLGAESRRYEVWQVAHAAQSGQQGRIQYRLGAGVVFGRLSIAESELGASCGATSALQRATELAYREIFAAVDALAMPHLVRVWNFLPDINGKSHGSERYWQFNSARQDGFIACARAVTGAVPAACGVGSPSGAPLVIYFLASATAPTVIENPRQVSAYHYPPAYSPRSPTFSRACVVDFPHGQMLFISGTASIIGHATVHVGDAAAQTRETLRNIEALLGAANRGARTRAPFAMPDLCYKAYVRHAADLELIERELRAALGAGAQALYLHADLCREDLSVEIEATGCQFASSGS